MSIETTKPQNTKGRKLVIFDFDNTLLLWKLGGKAKADYERDIKRIFDTLKASDTILAIASSSTQLDVHIALMDIAKYFDYILFCDSREKRSRTKGDMVTEIMSFVPQIHKKDILFFDDDVDAIKEVRKIGIKTICVSSRSGILPFYGHLIT